MANFEPKGVPYTQAAVLPALYSYPTLREHALAVLATHCDNINALVGPARIGSFGVEHESGEELLGAWVALSDDRRILFFQSPFREPGTFWTDSSHFMNAQRAFQATIEQFDGTEIENDMPTDGSWERYLNNLFQSEYLLAEHNDLMA